MKNEKQKQRHNQPIIEQESDHYLLPFYSREGQKLAVTSVMNFVNLRKTSNNLLMSSAQADRT